MEEDEKKKAENYLLNWAKDYLKQQFQQGVEKGSEFRRKTGKKFRTFILLCFSLIYLVTFIYGVLTGVMYYQGMMMSAIVIMLALCLVASMSFALLALKLR